VAMTRSSIPFMSFQSIIAISGSIIYVILSIVVSETEVGLYNAATQVITPVALIYESIVIAGFPMLCQRFNINLAALKRMSDRLIELVVSIALPATVGLILLGKKILLLVYSNTEFARSGGILRIMAASLIMSALAAVLARVLLASLREKILLRIIIIRFLVSLICGLILIKAFGLLGAALNFLLISVLDAGLHLFQVSRLYPKVFPWQRLWKTTLATMGMTVFLLARPDLGVVMVVGVGGFIYAALWLGLSIWSAGNVRQFKADYFGV
jgi:O-antigen/teichoic acid export membrane protein